MKKQQFLSLEITLGSYKIFVQEIIRLCIEKIPSYICVANVHMLVEAHKDTEFRKIVNDATICTPDGMPLVWGLKIIHGLDQDRVAGMDLLPDLLLHAEMNSIAVYFYGGSAQMLRNTEKYLYIQYPKLLVAGMHSPPFRALTKVEEQADIDRINKSNAGIIFVALGCPKQEKWMAKMKNSIRVPMIGVGGALPVMIGMQSRAPIWIQKASLEWLYRLFQEPKRLFKRYTITNTIFLWLLLKAKFQIKTDRNTKRK